MTTTVTRHKAHCGERVIGGRRGWRITCTCGDTWLRVGSLELAIEQTFDLHLKVLGLAA